MLQETKCNRIDFAYIVRFLPSFFDHNIAYNLAINSAGGIIIAWKHSYQLVNSWSTRHTLPVQLKQTGTNEIFTVCNAYGPTVEGLKEGFVQELRLCAAQNIYPWILAGDFNLVRWLVDRSSGSHSFRLMDLFNSFIADAGISDIQLQNRQYTWTSKRPVPSFSKLDRIFTSIEWSTAYPIITLEALEVLVSDHTPLLLTCKEVQQMKRESRMELYWFNYRMPKEMVQRLWGGQRGSQEGLICQFDKKIQVLQRALSNWQSEAFGEMEKMLDFCKRTIIFFDQIEER